MIINVHPPHPPTHPPSPTLERTWEAGELMGWQGRRHAQGAQASELRAARAAGVKAEGGVADHREGTWESERLITSSSEDVPCRKKKKV